MSGGTFTWVPDFPVKEEEVGMRTLVSSSESGKERRRSKVSVARRKFTLTFSQLTTSQVDAIWNFYVSQMGATYTFSWTRPARGSGDSSANYTVRFFRDGLSREWFLANLHNTGVEFIEAT